MAQTSRSSSRRFSGEQKAADFCANQQLEQLIARCRAGGVRVTPLRRLVLECLVDSPSHPTISDLTDRVRLSRPKASPASIYRAVALLESASVVERHHFSEENTMRVETINDDHHDHLVDLETGEVVEFCEPRIEQLQKEIACSLGYRLIGHRLHLYGVRLR